MMEEKYSRRGIYYKIARNNGMALLFMHGAGSNHTTWLPYLDHFANKGYTVIAPDMRGHGYSQVEGIRKAVLQDFIDDMDEILISEGIKEFVVVGGCFGSSIGIEVAKIYGMKKMVLINLFDMKTVNLGLLLKGGLRIVTWLLSMTDKMGIRRRNLPYKNYTKPKSKSNIYYTLSELRSVNLLSYMKSTSMLFDYDIELGANKGALVISGRNDLLSSWRKTRKICKKNSVEQKVVEGAGHFIITRKPDDLIKLVEEYIA